MQLWIIVFGKWQIKKNTKLARVSIATVKLYQKSCFQWYGHPANQEFASYSKCLSNFSLSAQSITCYKFADYDWKQTGTIYNILRNKCKEDRRKQGN